MDITHHFKASVMAVKQRHKDKQRILPKATPAAATALRDEFTKQARDVCQKITVLRNVLVENRAAYMRIGQFLKNAPEMTDEQRDLIDRESEKFVSFYTQRLGQLRSDWKRTKRKPQHQQHGEAVLDLLLAYLHSVEQLYLAQKKYRVQHELESYQLLKLAAEKSKIPVRPGGANSGKLLKMNSASSKEDVNATGTEDNAAQSGDSDIDMEDGWQSIGNEEPKLATHKAASPKAELTIRNRTQSKSIQQVAIDEDLQRAEQLDVAKETELSAEDVQMFEQENVQLYQELQGLAEEVEQIEKNVVDIAQLQDIFTEKVSLQQHNIERIANAVVGSTENVRDANEQIKQAIQRNAGLRVWSLFFLLVMSFALLFLDWYYD